MPRKDTVKINGKKYKKLRGLKDTKYEAEYTANYYRTTGNLSRVQKTKGGYQILVGGLDKRKKFHWEEAKKRAKEL